MDIFLCLNIITAIAYIYKSITALKILYKTQKNKTLDKEDISLIIYSLVEILLILTLKYIAPEALPYVLGALRFLRSLNMRL